MEYSYLLDLVADKLFALVENLFHFPIESSKWVKKRTFFRHVRWLKSALRKLVMRLWSLHPKYLDAKGLVALWREGLLAQKVLQGKTRGYRHHPQLQRFRQCKNPVAAISEYLWEIAREAHRRGYKFSAEKIAQKPAPKHFSSQNAIAVETGQLQYEFTHLQQKLATRAPKQYRENNAHTRIKSHKLFRKKSGGIAPWEVING